MARPARAAASSRCTVSRVESSSRRVMSRSRRAARSFAASRSASRRASCSLITPRRPAASDSIARSGSMAARAPSSSVEARVTDDTVLCSSIFAASSALRAAIVSSTAPRQRAAPRRASSAAISSDSTRYLRALLAWRFSAFACRSTSAMMSASLARFSSAAFSFSSASWRRAARPPMPAASSRMRRRFCGLAPISSLICPCLTSAGELAPVDASANSSCTSFARTVRPLIL